MLRTFLAVLLFCRMSLSLLATPTPDSFMHALPEDLKLKDLSLLGSHDSGTYQLYPFMGISPDEYGNFIYKIGNLPIIGHLIDMTIIKAWSVTQANDITGQLSQGVRYFDLRFAPDANGSFRICHGLFGNLMNEINNQINNFLNSHPKEIVLLDFTFMDIHGQELNQDQQSQVIQQMNQIFCSKIAPSTYGSDINLGQMWQNNKQVIIFWRDSAMARLRPDILWDRDTFLQSTWHNRANIADLVNDLNEGLAARPPEKFYVNQAVLTPNSDLIIKNIYRSLLAVEAETNMFLSNWYITKLFQKLGGNILMIDNVASFYNLFFNISFYYNLRRQSMF